jgi:hypothetical protein
MTAKQQQLGNGKENEFLGVYQQLAEENNVD